MNTADLKAGAPCVSVIEVLTDAVPAWLVVRLSSFFRCRPSPAASLSNGVFEIQS